MQQCSHAVLLSLLQSRQVLVKTQKPAVFLSLLPDML